jgi:hypothetical protein
MIRSVYSVSDRRSVFSGSSSAYNPSSSVSAMYSSPAIYRRLYASTSISVATDDVNCSVSGVVELFFETVFFSSTFSLFLFFPEEKYTSSKNSSCAVTFTVKTSITAKEINFIVFIFVSPLIINKTYLLFSMLPVGLIFPARV